MGEWEQVSKSKGFLFRFFFMKTTFILVVSSASGNVFEPERATSKVKTRANQSWAQAKRILTV